MKKIQKIRTLLVTCIIIASAFHISAQTQVADLEINKNNTMISFNGDLWIIGTGTNTSNNPSPYSILKSTDNGNTWNIEAPNDNRVRYKSKSVVFQNKIYSIGGVGITNNLTSKYRISEDGINWTEHNAPFGKRAAHQVVVHNNKLFMIAGFSTDAHKAENDVWVTSDGLNWTKATNSISTVFPHFYQPRVFSLNGKLVLFGGRKSDWSFLSVTHEHNQRGIYISEDDGQTWTRNEFPLDVNLHYDGEIYFKHNNRLYIGINHKRYAATGNFISDEARYYSSADGITWREETGSLPNLYTKFKAVEHNGNTLIFKQPNFGTTTLETYEEPIFNVTHTKGILKKVANNDNVSTPFTVQYADGSSVSKLEYCIESSNQEIIKSDEIIIENGELTFDPSDIIGETMITVNITDGSDSHSESFFYYNYPNADIDIRNLPNQRIDVGATPVNKILVNQSLSTYGDNTYSFLSSDENIIAAADITTYDLSVLRYLNISAIDNSSEAEVKISVIGTDGVTSDTSSFWVKIGNDEAPVANGNLDDLTFSGTLINYQLPTDAFTDPEGEPLTYSTTGLPCGIGMDHKTGTITGITNASFPAQITIIATDKYGQTAEHVLNIVDGTVNIDNTLSEASFTVYPNPVHDIITINTDINESMRIEIYNNAGQQVKQIKRDNANEDVSIDLSDLNNGMYVIRIISDNYNQTKKIIKQ